MARRSFGTVEMKLPIEGEKEAVMRELMAEFGDILEIDFDLEMNLVHIHGDLHDYRMRNRIMRIVSGGKRGIDVQAN